jgi:drug/metabolite transporter (DMT)-like permease
MSCVGSLTAVSATLTRYPVYGGQAIRYAVAALILLAIARYTDRRRQAGRPVLRPRDLAQIGALAATGLAGFNVVIVEATRYTSPATIGTVIGTVPVILAIAAPLMAGRRPAARTVAAAGVVTLGAGVANGFGGGSLAGFALALAALGGEVCFSLLALPLLPRIGAIRLSGYAAAAAVPLLVAAALVTGGPIVRMPTVPEAAGLGYLTVVVTVGAFLLWYDALDRLGADRAGLFAGFIPISAVVTTMLLGLSLPGIPDLAGAALVGCGVAVGMAPPRMLRRGRRSRSAEAGVGVVETDGSYSRVGPVSVSEDLRCPSSPTPTCCPSARTRPNTAC